MLSSQHTHTQSHTQRQHPHLVLPPVQAHIVDLNALTTPHKPLACRGTGAGGEMQKRAPNEWDEVQKE